MRRLIVLLATGLVLAACSEQPDKAKVDVGSKSSATSTPTATASKTGTLLDLAPPKPERPKDERTKAGAIAFTDYFFKSMFYAYGTADPQPISDIADTALCRGCKIPLENARVSSENGRLLMGAKPVETSDPDITNLDGEFVTLRVVVEYPQLILVVAKSGKAEGDRRAAENEPTTVNLKWQDDKWVLLDFQDAESKK